MKNSILLSLIMILSTNVFLVVETPTSNEESIQISEEEKVEQIQPTGAWFTEDDELP